jgi:cytochrome c553
MILTGLGLIMLPAAYLGQTRQHPGTPDAAAPPSFLAECGSCHGVFHPSLMNRQNWGQVMAGLADHFGEDASLPDGEAREIAAYLQSHAAEAYDTKPARLIGRGGIPADLRITASAFWKRAHHTIDSTIFTRKSVGQRSNCGACHEDASTGRFAPQLISIPKE